MLFTEWYATTAGIAGASWLIVNVLKRLLGNVPVVQKVPTWVYAVAVACGLTVGGSYLEVVRESGTLLDLLTRAVVAAALASGFRDWYQHANEPIANTTDAQARRGILR